MDRKRIVGIVALTALLLSVGLATAASGPESTPRASLRCHGR